VPDRFLPGGSGSLRMQGEEDSERNVGSSSSAFSSTVAKPATQVTVFKPSAPPLRTTAPPAQYAPKRHHRHKDEDASSEDEDRSKLELECQFAGIDIDPDTAELDLDDDDINVDNGEDFLFIQKRERKKVKVYINVFY
jgi:hypothetical protein